MPFLHNSEISEEQRKYLFSRTRFLANVPQEQYDKWVKDYKAITDSEILVDPSKKTNFFCDRNKGFSFIDLNFKSNDILFEREDFMENKSIKKASVMRGTRGSLHFQGLFDLGYSFFY